MGAPSAPGPSLRGLLSPIAVFLLGPLLLVAGAGVQFLGADMRTLSWFAANAVAGTIAALGVLAIVGTWPRLMRPDADGQILQGGKSFLAAMVLVTLFELVVAPALFGWLWLDDHARREGLSRDAARALLPWITAGAFAYALLVGAFGLWLGSRNYRRLLAPR
jgi:hypothetical protein